MKRRSFKKEFKKNELNITKIVSGNFTLTMKEKESMKLTQNDKNLLI